MAPTDGMGLIEVVDVDQLASQNDHLATQNKVEIVTDLLEYQGDTTGERVESFIQTNDVVVIAKSHCPFCRDVLDLLGNQLGVNVHVINVDHMPNASEIHKHVIDTYKHRTFPAVFARGKFLGGCEEVKALRSSGILERETLAGLMHKQRARDTEKVETAHLVPTERSRAIHPLFWFPNVVNNYVVRVTGFQVFVLSVLSAAFPNDAWGRYTAVGLLIDFLLRFMVGSSASPLGMIATLVVSPFHPQFKPGPPKQFAAFCGVFFTLMGTIFYFVEFKGHQYVGCAFMAGLAGASGLEWVLDFCLGCLFYSWGIMFGLIPDVSIIIVETVTLKALYFD